MASRRRNSQAPFEVMRSNGRRMAGAVPAPEPEEAASPSLDVAPEAGDRRWFSPHPIVLRIPQGYAVLGGLLVLGLLVLAFLIGDDRGYKRHERDVEQQAAQAQQERQAGQGYLASAVAQGSDAAAPTPVGQGSAQEVLNRPDTREPGLNYFTLARLPLQDAQRLVQWLAGHGVEAIVKPADNARLDVPLYYVIDLRGFTGSELRAEGGGKAYRRKMQALGREWKRETNHYDDLSTMYPVRYEP